jgi:hypothetical protein
LTALYVESSSIVEPKGPPPGPPAIRLLCERCHSEAHHNPTLRLSFCPTHGFASLLLMVGSIGYARAHAATR